MLRWFGGALILCGGLLARRTLLEDARRPQRVRRALADAFDAMEAEIHALLTPVPALLRQSRGGEAEAFFRAVSRGLARGEALGTAWRRAAAELPLRAAERETVALLGARFSGDEESIRAALALASAELRRNYEQIETRRGERERLTTTICVSISLLLAILLL